MTPARPVRLAPLLLLAGLAAMLLAGAPRAAVQSPADPGKVAVPRVAVLTWRGPTDSEKGFKDELARLGYHPAFIEADCGQDPERLAANLRRLAREAPDLVYTFGTTVTLAAMQVIKDRPIVFSLVSNPDKTGIMQSLEGSGRNVAGATHAVSESSLLNLLLEILPAKIVGVIFNPAEKNSLVAVARLRGLAGKAGVRLVEQQLLPGGDPRAAAESLIRQGIDAAILPTDSLIVSHGREIVGLLNAGRIPTVAALEPYVAEHGALIGLVGRYEDAGREAARVADRILRGEDPAGIPLAYVRPVHIVNLRTAKALGLSIPDWITRNAAAIIR